MNLPRRSILSRIGCRLLACVLSAAAAAPVQADLYVVVHADNPSRSMTQKEVLDLYMGRTRVFAHGDVALPFDLPRDSAGRERFYQALAGMGLSQVNSYWSRLMFTGQSMPPLPLPGEAEMLAIVRRNPNAVGYLASEPNDRGVRTVLVLREPR